MMKIINMLRLGCCITHASDCQTHTAEAALRVDLLDVISFCFQLPQLIRWVRYCTHTPRICLHIRICPSSLYSWKKNPVASQYLTQTVRRHKETWRKQIEQYYIAAQNINLYSNCSFVYCFCLTLICTPVLSYIMFLKPECFVPW